MPQPNAGRLRKWSTTNSPTKSWKLVNGSLAVPFVGPEAPENAGIEKP